MAKKQPDRFERIVLRALKKQDQPGCRTILLNPLDFAKILRQEHRTVINLITKNPLFGAENTEWKQGYTQACQDILDQLSEMENS